MTASPTARPRGRPVDQVINWVPSLVFAVALPYLTYTYLTGRHLTGEAAALLISGAWPALESAVMLAVRRKVDELGVLVLLTLGIGALSMVAFNSPSLILIKESAVTGLLGVAFLISLLLPRPLMFYFGRKFATNGTREAVAYWNGLWQFAGFRRTERVLTVVWGVAFIAEAVLRIIVVSAGVLPTSSALLFSNFVPYVVLAGLITFTFTYSRRSVRRSAAATAASDELKRPATDR